MINASDKRIVYGCMCHQLYVSLMNSSMLNEYFVILTIISIYNNISIYKIKIGNT